MLEKEKNTYYKELRTVSPLKASHLHDNNKPTNNNFFQTHNTSFTAKPKQPHLTADNNFNFSNHHTQSNSNFNNTNKKTKFSDQFTIGKQK